MWVILLTLACCCTRDSSTLIRNSLDFTLTIDQDTTDICGTFASWNVIWLIFGILKRIRSTVRKTYYVYYVWVNCKNWFPQYQWHIQPVWSVACLFSTLEDLLSVQCVFIVYESMAVHTRTSLILHEADEIHVVDIWPLSILEVEPSWSPWKCSANFDRDLMRPDNLIWLGFEHNKLHSKLWVYATLHSLPGAG